ncbi:type II/IV secretion system ATPase subunit [Haloterrigena salifodinae]|uniref:type II/IV secretion system ATPase subunit n=1 Tax=Haloterrigena salifodinae TaxID=2675099 RepID=UPI001B86EEA5|nr:type II/IV secretion system ATPase subunit [Haloterrigena salifodinae]
MAWQIDPGDFDETSLSSDLEEQMDRHPHLEEHVTAFHDRTNVYPRYIDEPEDHHNTTVDHPNYCWQIDDLVFAHVYGSTDQDPIYYAIEPSLSYDEVTLFREVKNRVLNKNVTDPGDVDREDIEEVLEPVVSVTTEAPPEERSAVDGFLGRLRGALSRRPISVDQRTYERLRYQFRRDVLGLGPLEPVLLDDSNEDIHVLAHDNLHVYNDVFGLVRTDIDFGSEYEYEHFLRSMGERIGDPLSDADPITDGTLPDGSRFNVVFSNDVSVKGPSMTIRQQDEIPLTMTAITRGGTFSPTAAAYLWLAMENETSAIVAGETASGKTTTLNALTSFIPDDAKIFTAEDTAEVIPPHDTWQQLLTREGTSNEVDLFDLVAAALRSRPDCIIIGEARGEEVRMAFQAIQTGHPVMMTFHAGNIKSLVQRLKGNPINVPYSHLDNLDLVIFQNFIQSDDYRRCTSIYEIDKFSSELGGLVTNKVFEWDPVDDQLEFTGMNNSVLLEDKIATLHGYEDTRDIYDDLEYRRRIIEKMVYKNVVDYEEFNRIISEFQQDGHASLPFHVEKPESIT